MKWNTPNSFSLSPSLSSYSVFFALSHLSTLQEMVIAGVWDTVKMLLIYSVLCNNMEHFRWVKYMIQMFESPGKFLTEL